MFKSLFVVSFTVAIVAVLPAQSKTTSPDNLVKLSIHECLKPISVFCHKANFEVLARQIKKNRTYMEYAKEIVEKKLKTKTYQQLLKEDRVAVHRLNRMQSLFL